MVKSTPDMPSIIAWWIFQTIAVWPSARPWSRISFQSGWRRSQHPAVDAAADLGHRAVVGGRGQRDLVDVVGDVEVRIVLPRRMREGERGNTTFCR